MKRAGFQKFLARSQEVVEELWGDQIDIAGILYPCAIGARRLGGTMGLGGDIKEGFLNIRIRKSVLPVPPEDGETVLKYAGRRWRVDEVKDQAAESVWALACIPADE